MPSETLSDRYLIERKLGSGGAAEVLLAADTILHRQVAIKRLHGWLSADREARVRFQQEAQAFARLTHPHIVTLFDVGEDNNRPYLVMEYLEGETLRKIITAEGPFHPDDIAVVIEHIGEALDYAHKRGVVHRDIKPENVLVDRHGVVKVVDFGIAKVLEDATITQAGLAPGTAQYISPEQAQGHPVTSASDIYSLGVVAYEMLAGRPPFTGDSAVAVATQHVNERPPSPSDVNPLAPRLASEIILRALAKRPSDRFTSAGEFAQAMLNWKGTPPARTRPVPGTAPEPLPTVRIPTREIEPATAPAAVRAGESDEPQAQVDGATSGLGRAGIGVAAVLALLVVGAILWLLLDRDNPGGTSPTSTVGTLAEAPLADPTERAVPTATDAAPAAIATVPALVGLPLTEAEAIDGITLSVEERADAAPAGTILEQDPPEGSPIDDGVVRVVVSTGEATDEPTMIDLASLRLTGRPAEEVFRELTELGLNVQGSEVTAQEMPQGQVVGFLPGEAQPGDTVTVQVSMGNRVQVPADLQGQSLDGATSALQEQGLTVGDPLPVSRAQIQAQLGPNAVFPFEDQDVVGIQDEGIAFGDWVPAGSTVQLVYYDAGLDQ